MEVHRLNYLDIVETIGKPYKLESNPPYTFNCWSLIHYLQPHAPSFEPEKLKEYIEIFNDQPEKLEDNQRWVEVDEIKEGDVLLLGKNNYYTHAGIFLYGNKMLHAKDKAGVVIESLNMVKLRYKNIKAYRWL